MKILQIARTITMSDAFKASLILLIIRLIKQHDKPKEIKKSLNKKVWPKFSNSLYVL